MKKQIEEPDFIGGLGPLTDKEAAALSAYFAQKKAEQKALVDQQALAKRTKKEKAALK